MNWEKNVVLADCVDHNGKTAPRRVVQACTESLDHDILPIDQRSLLLASRADAYFALGDKQHALDDYDAAAKSASILLRGHPVTAENGRVVERSRRVGPGPT